MLHVWPFTDEPVWLGWHLAACFITKCFKQLQEDASSVKLMNSRVIFFAPNRFSLKLKANSVTNCLVTFIVYDILFKKNTKWKILMHMVRWQRQYRCIICQNSEENILFLLSILSVKLINRRKKIDKKVISIHHTRKCGCKMHFFW